MLSRHYKEIGMISIVTESKRRVQSVISLRIFCTLKTRHVTTFGLIITKLTIAFEHYDNTDEKLVVVVRLVTISGPPYQALTYNTRFQPTLNKTTRYLLGKVNRADFFFLFSLNYILTSSFSKSNCTNDKYIWSLRDSRRNRASGVFPLSMT